MYVHAPVCIHTFCYDHQQAAHSSKFTSANSMMINFSDMSKQQTGTKHCIYNYYVFHYCAYRYMLKCIKITWMKQIKKYVYAIK